MGEGIGILCIGRLCGSAVGVDGCLAFCDIALPKDGAVIVYEGDMVIGQRCLAVLEPEAVRIFVVIVCGCVCGLDRSAVGILQDCGIGRDGDIFSTALSITVESACGSCAIIIYCAAPGGSDDCTRGGRKDAVDIDCTVDLKECGFGICPCPRAAVSPAGGIDYGSDIVIIYAVPSEGPPLFAGNNIECAGFGGGIGKGERSLFTNYKSASGHKHYPLIGGELAADKLDYHVVDGQYIIGGIDADGCYGHRN